MITDAMLRAAYRAYGATKLDDPDWMRTVLEAAEAAAWQAGTEGAPLDGTPILIEIETTWGSRVHRVCWSDTEMWVVEDRKHGPFPLRGYINIRRWRYVPAPPTT